MFNKIFKISKGFHKYLGLIVILYLMWMSISGILLNHPKLISSISIPKYFVPNSYHIKNWNRGAIKSIVKIDSQSMFVYGRLGVFKTTNAGKTFSNYMQGNFPKSAYNKKTAGLYYDSISNSIIASTKAGFFISDIHKSNWNKIESLKTIYNAQKIIKVKNDLLAFSASAIYRAKNNGDLNFTLLNTKKDKVDKTISLSELFFKLHDGRILGNFGVIIWDFIALILFFLSLSALYIWFIPKKWKKKKRNNKSIKSSQKKKLKFFYKYHLKLGIITAFILIIIVFTGMFIHPPLSMLIRKSKVSDKWLILSEKSSIWKEKIKNAVYDSYRDKIIVNADGLWETDSDLSKPFCKSKIKARVFGMGATVLETTKDSSILIGSFSGLKKVKLHTNLKKNILPKSKIKRRGGLGAFMVTGYFETPNQKYFNCHKKGLLKLDGSKDDKVFIMPKFISDSYEMSLWNYAFEIHNARFFRSFIGFIYFFLNPILGLLTLLVILSGVFDWIYRKIKK